MGGLFSSNLVRGLCTSQFDKPALTSASCPSPDPDHLAMFSMENVTKLRRNAYQAMVCMVVSSEIDPKCHVE